VTGPHDDDEGIAAEGQAGQRGVLLLLADQGDVVAQREDPLDDALGGVETQDDVDARVPPVEDRDEVRGIRAAGRSGDEAQPPAGEPPRALEVPARLVHEREDPAGVVLQDRAGVGEPGAAADALEELHAAVPLELADLQRHRWLGDRQRLGRPGEAAGAGDGLEDAELVQRHAAEILSRANLMKWARFISVAASRGAGMLDPWLTGFGRCSRRSRWPGISIPTRYARWLSSTGWSWAEGCPSPS